MASLTLVLPILPGKLESVKQACAVASGVRRVEYERSRLRLGITREALWLAASGDFLLWLVEAVEPDAVLLRLGASPMSFDRWYVRHIREAHGLDLSRGLAPAGAPLEELLAWHSD